MKFDLQVRVLQTMGRMGTDKRPVDADRLSMALDKAVSHYTVGLSNGFFVECGWLQKVGRGDYAATGVLVDYARRLTAEGTDAAAVAELRGSAVDGWFWQVMEPRLAHGPIPLSEVVVALMQEAEVGQSHAPQIRMLLDWLIYVRLIAIEGNMVRRVDDSSDDLGTGSREAAEMRRADPTQVALAAEISPDAPAKPAPAVAQHHVVPAQQLRQRAADALLAFDFSFSLTSEDLAKLSPEQIRSLFDAVGAVMAIKATITTS